MQRMLRHTIAITSLSGLVLLGYHLATGSGAAVASVGEDAGGVFKDFWPDLATFTGGYSLSSLPNLRKVDALIDQQYVDPQRIDHEEMFRSALAAVERMVPEVLLDLDASGENLSVEVGAYHGSLKVEKIKSFSTLESALRKVAAVLEEHVDAKEYKHQEIEYALINGVLTTLDPHSVFLPPEGSKEMQEDNEGEFGGLGISIRNDEKGYLVIDYPMEGTPAWKAGLQAQDQIVRIEGEETLNMDLKEAVKRMRGAPGTKITISIVRPGEGDGARDVTLTRAMIKPNEVWARLMKGNVGFIHIDQFHAQVETQLQDCLMQLGKESKANGGELKGIILDLRGNPGGYLHQAVAVVDQFLKDGVIVSTVDRGNRNRDEKLARDTGTEPQIPIIVLMSGTSASASEIVAGALKNQERAAIMGERSFGKGSVQNLYPFQDDARLKLTVARYLTPGDHSIQGVGISPDIELDAALVAPAQEIERDGAKIMGNPRISLFYRDQYIEEADLEGALTQSTETDSPPVYALRYLLPVVDEKAPRTDRPDPEKDPEAALARDVLLATKGARRADVLRDAERVLAARQPVEAARLEAAFKGLGIDWGACARPQAATVQMRLTVVGAEQLTPGGLHELQLTATNTGRQPICQGIVRAESGNNAVDGAEFYLGRLAPGQTVSRTVKIDVADGYPAEVAGVDLSLFDMSGEELAHATAEIRTAGAELPRYAWDWRFDDSLGDNDGIPEPGEVLSLAVSVRNVGTAPGGRLTVSVQKGDGVGKSVELVSGTFTVEDLAPGAAQSGNLTLRYVAPPTDPLVLKDGLPFELNLRESERYDYGSIVKAQFYPYIVQTETLRLSLSSKTPSGIREVPSVQITRAPDAVASGEVTLSGVATDEAGIRDVILYLGDKKIAYFSGNSAPGEALKSVPFSATTRLSPGNNLLVVLVRDSHGLTTTRAVDVYTPGAGGSKDGSKGGAKR